jgi:hypothetical protein
MKNQETKQDIQIKKQKKEDFKQSVIFMIFNLIILFLVFGFSIWWQGSATLKAFADGIWLVFSIQLTMAWSFFVYNKNIFTPLIHGSKTFILLFLGRKPKEDYYTAYMKVQDNPIPKYVVTISFIFLCLTIFIGLILTYLAY